MLRAFWRFVLICADLTNDFLGKNGPHLAAGVTYYFLFSLLPLTLAMTSVIGFLARGTNLEETAIATVITSFLPVAKEDVALNLEVLARTKLVTGLVGILGLMWVSTTVFGGIRKGINAVWGISKPRAYFHERFIDISFTMGAGLLLLAPLAVTVIIAILSGLDTATATADPTFMQNNLRQIVTFFSPLASIAVFMVLYRYLPNTKVTFRDVWPGAVMAAFAFEAAKWSFLWYTSTFPVVDSANVVYGPLGALIALLTWVFVSANILFFGALVTSRYSVYLSRKAEEKSLQFLANFKQLRATETKEHV